ncbi:MAG: YhcH/YjgK/YiaL family protein [Acidobacteriota bacterium]
MIADTLDQSVRYAALHPAFARAFAFLSHTDLSSLAPGRHAIDGDRIFVSIDHQNGRGRDGARMEAHREHIDIQLTLDGAEEIGWMPLAGCRLPVAPYDSEKDITFFSDRPDTWIQVPAGTFAIFFPDDAHAPLAGRGPLKKAIVKIAINRTPSL